MPGVVEVPARLGIRVLAGEAQRAVDHVVGRVASGDSPQRGALSPDHVAVEGDQFGRGADEISDDGVETSCGAELFEFALAIGTAVGLRVGAGAMVVELGQGPVGARRVVPGQGVAARAGLLGQLRA